MSSSPVDRISGASTPALLAMSSLATNRLHDELHGLKRWRQMYDTAMNEKNEELQKLQLINERQAQTLNDSIAQIEQQTTTINTMKQNEILLEKKVAKLEELHHILKKNFNRLEKTVSQCEFVRVDLERMYESQERAVKSLADRVDSTVETKLKNLQSQMKLIEQLHEQARHELNKQINEHAQEKMEATNQMIELNSKITISENEINQLQTVNTIAQTTIFKLNEEINKYQQTIEHISIEYETKLKLKYQEIEDLQNRIDHLVLKIDGNKEEIFNLQESNKNLQIQIDEMKQKTIEDSEYYKNQVHVHQTEIDQREKNNEELKLKIHDLIEQLTIRSNDIEELKTKNQLLETEMNVNLEKQVNEAHEQFQKQFEDYAKRSIEDNNRLEQLGMEINEKDKMCNEFKSKYDELLEKMEVSEEEISQLTKENEELRTQNHVLVQESDEHNERMKQKDVIVEATNIEIGEKDKEIEELQNKVKSLEERLSKNQNLLTSLRSSMGEKDAKIKRLEQEPIPSQTINSSRSATVRRTGINHPLAVQQKVTPSRTPLLSSISTNQQTKVNQRDKRMLAPPGPNESTSTPKKILRLSQTKAAIEQAHSLDKSISPVFDDDRDEIASNTSVASLFEYLKKI